MKSIGYSFAKKLLNKTLVVSALSLSLLGVARADNDPPRSKEVVVDISSVFIPNGFGTNDPFAVISGIFPNSCYAFKGVSVNRVTPNLHEVRAIANVRQGMCLMMLIPYSEEAALGKLDRGTHTLRFMSSNGTYTERTVEIQ
jgi:hypothetical protein